MAKQPALSPAPKKGRGKKQAVPEEADVEVVVDDGTGMEPVLDPLTGVVQTPQANGDVLITFGGNGRTPSLSGVEGGEGGPKREHSENLAEFVDHIELGRIAEDLISAIDSDKGDRAQWENDRAEAITLLGLKIEKPKGDVSTSSLGMSTSSTRDPLLQEAVWRFQANAYGELCPASGPVKVVDFGNETIKKDGLAQALEDDFNYYLTTTASEYYPDTRRMLFWTGLASGTFKKVYKCPLRRRPVSEYVDGTDLIVPTNATDLKNAGRITHEVTLRRSVMLRMQILGIYRDVVLDEPVPADPNPVQQRAAQVEGKQAQPQRPEDQDYTVYECYCELDLPGFHHKEDGEATGLPLPYRVTIESSSRQVLEIRRNWDEDDKDYKAKIPFVLFPFATGLGIYGTGLGQMLGNGAMALTALLRVGIDSGMFANFPGLIKAKGAGRQIVNELRVPVGGMVDIDTNGQPIRDVVMGMPYREFGAPTMALMVAIREVYQRLGGTADAPVGEGKQDAPVGTTLALIEQATKIESAVHKALHAAQAEEFKLLVELLQDDPEAIWRGNKRAKMGADEQVRIARFKEALDRCDIVPMADPNTPSHMHRLMKAMAVKQLQAANPTLYDAKAVDIFVGDTIKVDVETLFAPPPPPNTQPDPKMMELMIKDALEKLKIQFEEKKLLVDADQKDKDRKSNETIETLKIAQALAVHPESNQIVDDQLVQMAPFLHPLTGEPTMPPLPGPETMHHAKDCLKLCGSKEDRKQLLETAERIKALANQLTRVSEAAQPAEVKK